MTEVFCPTCSKEICKCCSNALDSALERAKSLEFDADINRLNYDHLQNIKKNYFEEIQKLKAENARFREALRRIAAEDFRGPRPWSASFAYKVLHGDEE